MAYRPGKALTWIVYVALLVPSVLLGRQLVPYQPRQVFNIPDANDVRFAPDGRTLYTGISWAHNSAERITAWDVQSGQPRFRVGREVESLIFRGLSQDGRWLATYSHEKGLFVWDTGTGNPVFSAPPSKESAPDVSFSPTGELLLVDWAKATEIPVRPLSSGRDLGAIPVTRQALASQPLVFSPDGRRLASWHDADGGITLRVWEVGPDRPVKLVTEHRLDASKLVVAPDLSTFATIALAQPGMTVITRWDMKSARQLDAAAIPIPSDSTLGWPMGLEYSPNGDYLYADHGRSTQFCRIHPRLELIGECGCPNGPTFSPSGSKLADATLHGAQLVTLSDFTIMTLENPDDLRPYFIPPHVQFSPNGRWVSVTNCREYDPQNQTLMDRLVKYLPFQKSTEPGIWVVRLWDTETGQQAHAFHDAMVHFAPDGASLMALVGTRAEDGSYDSHLEVYDFPLRRPWLWMVLVSACFWLLLAAPIALARRLLARRSPRRE